MAINIKYRSIKAFLLTVETRSFTRAAERLGVTQPSFTSLIKDLEAILGLKLFERTTRSIDLTSAGEEFAIRVERPILDLEEAYASMADLASVRRGAVVFGALPSVALSLIPETISRLGLGYPSIEIRLIEAHNEQLLSMLRTNQIEFALAAFDKSGPEFHFVPLVHDQFCAVFTPGHSISATEPLGWRDLWSENLILLSRGSSARMQFERAQGNYHEAPGIRYDVTHMGTAVQLARQRLGVALLPRLALHELRLDGLKSREISDNGAQRTIGIVRRRDRHIAPAARILCDELAIVAARRAAHFGWTDPEPTKRPML